MRLAVMIPILVALLLPIPLGAETTPPMPAFEAKRIGVTKAPIGKRITIQIEPEDLARQSAPRRPAPSPEAQAPDQPDTPGQPGSYAWFWTAISPAMVDSGPGRLEPALQKLNKPPSGAAVAAPRISHLREIIQAFGPDILTATIGTEVSPALALAVIAVESSGRADAESGAGAQGLMQLIPATAERFGVEDSFDPAQNIGGGVAYLDWLLKEFDRDPMLALAGYNAGEGAVRNHEGVPPYAETRDYVPKVLAAFSVARALCRVPPEILSDGCIFALN